MTSRKSEKVVKALLKKGFVCKYTHHRFLVFSNQGKSTDIITFVSHEKREMSDALLSAMARQISLSKEDFLLLIDCTIDESDLIARYKEIGKID